MKKYCPWYQKSLFLSLLLFVKFTDRNLDLPIPNKDYNINKSKVRQSNTNTYVYPYSRRVV